MQLIPLLFYRMYGLLRIQQLQSPKLTDLLALELPRDAILHYVTHMPDEPEINEDMPFISKLKKKVAVDHITALKSTLGSPMRTAEQPAVPVRNFHQKHKLFRFFQGKLPAYATITDPTSLIVENYAYLPELYKYSPMPINKYYAWYNIEKTVWENMAEVAKKSSRAQFVIVEIPELLPSFISLITYSKKTTVSMLNIFDTPQKLFLLEIWKWLSDEVRSTSIMSSVPEDRYGNINLIFLSKGKWSVINMGYLFSWLKSNDHTEKLSGKTKVDSVQLQKLFLKMLMQVNSITHQAEQEELSDLTIEADKATSNLPIDTPTPEASVSPDMKISDIKPNIAVANPTPVNNGENTDVDDRDSEADIKTVNEIMPDIEKDLETLGVIEKKALMRKDIHITDNGDIVEDVPEVSLDYEQIATAVEIDSGVEDVLNQQLEQLAEYGVLSANDYRSSKKLITASSQIKDPYGSDKTIVAAAVVSPEDLDIPAESTAIKVNNSNTVVDHSMLSSSLKVFDRKYVSGVMKKDIVGAVRNIQKAGMIVTGYDIERDKSITGEYEYHVIQVKPIDGVSSSVRFKLPVVKEDGSFLANGNKYVMRKMRSERPLRKINSTTVALTSYYGRTFISRNSKKANDPIAWLAKQIILQGMANDGGHISAVSPADVFDNQFKAPAIYSALASHFKSFKAGNYELIFDHHERINLIPEPAGGIKGITQQAILQLLEKDGKCLVGVNKRQYIVVGQDDLFYEVNADGSDLKPIGSIFGICLLDELQAPVSYLDLKVFSKEIPLGVVLGYFLGFNVLLKYLEKYGITYRTVEPRKAKNLESHEWVLQFSDVQYIFSRRNSIVSLILSGFLDYEKSLKKYTAEEFNHKDIYLNLLESKGISALYIRELELMNSLYVDNITRDILIELHEPTTFKGLLFRAAEMLTNYTHPDAQDMSNQRIKGYERFAGAIYKELVIATRSYKNRNIRGKSKVEMNPYAVWTNIMQDPSVKLSEEINPINNLKEAEAVTYVGEGGRAKEGMNRESRAYHQNDIGVISEATVDSGDVGINTYMVPDPKFISLRGISQKYEQGNDGPARMLSTSALLAPGATNDD